MVANRETPMARARRDTTSTYSPAARAPVPLGASAAPRCTDAAVDVPEKDIPASPDMACDLRRGREGKEQEEARSGVAKELGAGELFIGPLFPSGPSNDSTDAVIRASFAKKRSHSHLFN